MHDKALLIGQVIVTQKVKQSMDDAEGDFAVDGVTVFLGIGGRDRHSDQDFPMFEGVDEDGNLQAAHHPFTMPNMDDIDLIATDPLKVRSQSYDLVLNGWELGSGSVRIHRSDIQSTIFSALGISDEEAESRFGFLLGAFKYGAPPHAGFAFGIDRLVAIFAGEDNIREVIAFPKTQSGADVMTGAPKSITERQIRDLRIKINPKV